MNKGKGSDALGSEIVTLKQSKEHRTVGRALPLAVGLLGVAWNHFSGSPGIDGKFLAMYLAGALAALYLATEVFYGRFSAPNGLVVRLLLPVYLMGAVVSTIVSWDSIALVGIASHREGLLTFFLYATVFLAFADDSDSDRPAQVGFWLAVAVLINLGMGLTAPQADIALRFGRRFVGGFSEPSFLAGFLVLALPVIAYTARHAAGRHARILSIVALVAGHAQLFWSGSRAAYFGWIASMALLAFFVAKKRNATVYYAGAALLVFAPLLTTRFSGSSLLSGVTGRLETWRPLLISGQYILTGTGPDRLRPLTYNRYRLFGAHNGFVNDINQIGWLATIAFMAFVCVTLARLFMSARAREEGAGTVSVWLLAAILGYSVFMMGNYTRPYVNMIFWALLGMASWSAGGHPRQKIGSFARPALIIMSACLILASGFVGARSVVGSYRYWEHLNVDMSEAVVTAWRPLEAAVRIEHENEVFREARGHMALRLLGLGFTDIPGTMEIRAAAVEDWEFLVREVYNSREVYELLESAYTSARVPREKWMRRPPE